MQLLQNGKIRPFPEIYRQTQRDLICFTQVVIFLQRSLLAALRGGELSLRMIHKGGYKVVSFAQAAQPGRTSVIGAVTSVMRAIGVSVISVSTKADLARILFCLLPICHRTSTLHHCHQAMTRKHPHQQAYSLGQTSSTSDLSNLLHFQHPVMFVTIQSSPQVAGSTVSPVLVESLILNLETMISAQAATRNSLHRGASVQKMALTGGVAACVATA